MKINLNGMTSAVNGAIAGACLVTSQLVLAGPIPVYTKSINLNSPACAGLGDFISCSAPALNVLNGLTDTTSQPTGYVINTPQGELKSYIVVNAGGAAALSNQEVIPLAGEVDNGFKANTGGDNFLKFGVNAEEGINGGSPLGDTADHWDIDLQWLRQALTIDNFRHDLMIGFDFNQPQNNSVGFLDIWSLVTIRDVDGSKLDINYELNRATNAGSGVQNVPFVNSFESQHDFNDAPNSTDFVRVTNNLCVLPGGANNPLGVLPVNSDGSCNTGYVKIDNAQSTRSTEFINFLPELNSRLEQLIADGYDTMSVDVWMGCFNTSTRQGDFFTPQLADGGSTTGCDAGGFGDIYLLAGANVREVQVPEPGSLALLGLGLVGLVAARRRSLFSRG